MSVTTPARPTLNQSDWSLHRKGPADRARHNEKVKEAIKQHLPDIISQESILSSDGKRVVKIPIRSLDEPRFRHGDGHEKGVGQGQGGTKPGDVVGQGPPKPGEAAGPGAGNEPGIDYYEAEFTIEELMALVFADLGLPNLQEKKLQTVTTPSIQFTDIRKKGAMGNLAKRATIKQNILRNAMHGESRIGNFSVDDLRFKTWDDAEARQSSAVIFAMMDVSGSMGDFEKYIARAFYYWMLLFLRTNYQHVEVVFIAHHSEAKEVTEEEFFTKGESGGTICSSAYRLALDTIATRYPAADWNIYPFHFSDGDNYGTDNQRCKELVTQLLALSALVGYGEIRQPRSYDWYGSAKESTLMGVLKTIDDPKMTRVTLTKREDVFPALRQFFGTEKVDAAVAA